MHTSWGRFCHHDGRRWQHDPTSAKHLLETVVSGKADVALGTFEARGSGLRRVAWKMMGLASGLDFRDPTSGYRAMNASAIKALTSSAASMLDHQDIGVLILLVRLGCASVRYQ